MPCSIFTIDSRVNFEIPKSMEGLFMPVISIHNLKKYYGKSRGADAVTMDVEEGEIYGFIGPNGAGKSTTIKLLLGLLKADSGSATIFGTDVLKDSRAVKSRIGYVPGDVRYYPDMKVSYLLDMTLRFHQKNPADYKAKTKEICEIFSIDPTKQFESLSLGNKKKVAIAQAVIHNPDLILLDEPTNGLDPLIQKNLFDYLQSVNREGTTILFSSHNLSEVKANCGRAGFIKDGKIIETEDLASNEHQEKVVTVTLGNSSGFALPSSLPGTGRLLKQEDRKYSFHYAGDTVPLLKYLSTLAPSDILIEDESLESRFLSYYEGGKKA